MGIATYVLAFGFLLIGLYALVAKKNMVRIIIGIAILGYAVNLLMVLYGYRRGGGAPIEGRTGALPASVSDPLPQSMVLAMIVIALGVTALAVGLAIRLYEKYGTFDLNDIRNLRG